MRRATSLSALALVVIGLGALHQRSTSAAPAPLAATLAATPVSTAASARTGSPRAGARMLERRYALDYRHTLSVDGQAQIPLRVRGTWTTATSLDRDDDRIGVVLSDAELSGMVGTLSGRDLQEPFEIAKGEQGSLSRLGFSPETPIAVRGHLGTLASALWYSPGEGARWTVEEQDRTGRYWAVYARRGANEVVRTRARFTAVRGPTGLDPAEAKAFSATGETRFLFDAEGLCEVVVDERITMRMGDGLPTLVAHVEATLRRIESREVAHRRGDPLPLEELRAHGQADDSSKHDVDRERLGGASTKEVLDKLGAVAGLPQQSKAESRWRTDAFLTTRALLRVKPEATAEVEKAFRDHAAGDPRVVSLLAGALGEAGTPQANAALIDLLSSDLPTMARHNVAGAMAMSEAPTAASVEALKDAMSDPEIGHTSALALGAQARTLATGDRELSGSAVAELIQRYEAATTRDERLVYLNALANSGAPEALPIMRAALASGDSRLAQSAAYGLRFIPGSEADELLAGLLRGDASQALKVQAIEAIGFRDPKVWKTRLVEARAQQASNLVREAIDSVLSHWP
ncbi:Hypothetical protein A7982_01953 [Minicystis rosea]|nr:Hypothetical protein A7982_01953 [Minicystis rosea]